MHLQRLITSLLWLLLWGRPQVSVNANLDYTRVHLVDHNVETNNFLFRGNMPVANHTVFQYDQLLSYLKKRAAEAGVDFPSNFQLVDISLNNLFDKDLKVEKAFWSNPDNKKLGRFINWPLGLLELSHQTNFHHPNKKKWQTLVYGKLIRYPLESPTLLPW